MTLPASAGEPQAFATQAAWTAWLRAHHSTSSGIWLRIAKKDAGVASVSYRRCASRASPKSSAPRENSPLSRSDQRAGHAR
jgi:hypothetical protein